MQLYTIGEISKLTNIPVKTLRYYDEIGVVVPERRDEESRYRLYSQDQILHLRIVKQFQALDFSLAEIKSLLHGRNPETSNHIDALKTKLQTKLTEVETEINRLQFQAESIRKTYESYGKGLDALLTVGEGTASVLPLEHFGFSIQMMPETWALSVRKYSNLNAQQLFLDRCFELQERMDAYRLFQSGGFFCILHDGYEAQFQGEYGDLELCVPIVRPDSFDAPELKRFEPVLVAKTMHIGHYMDAKDRYEGLVRWIGNQGYRIAGPPVEWYLIDVFHLVSPDKYITNLSFPIEKQD